MKTVKLDLRILTSLNNTSGVAEEKKAEDGSDIQTTDAAKDSFVLDELASTCDGIVCDAICEAIHCDEATCDSVCDQICANVCDQIFG